VKFKKVGAKLKSLLSSWTWTWNSHSKVRNNKTCQKREETRLKFQIAQTSETTNDLHNYFRFLAAHPSFPDKQNSNLLLTKTKNLGE
jgi:hypothetical protein